MLKITFFSTWFPTGPTTEEVTGRWKKLHIEELHNLYSSPNIVRMMKSRRMRWVVHVAQMGEMRNAYKILARKPKGNRSLVRLKTWAQMGG
jgi:hypothetical protein